MMYSSHSLGWWNRSPLRGTGSFAFNSNRSSAISLLHRWARIWLVQSSSLPWFFWHCWGCCLHLCCIVWFIQWVLARETFQCPHSRLLCWRGRGCRTQIKTLHMAGDSCSLIDDNQIRMPYLISIVGEHILYELSVVLVSIIWGLCCRGYLRSANPIFGG